MCQVCILSLELWCFDTVFHVSHCFSRPTVTTLHHILFHLSLSVSLYWVFFSLFLLSLSVTLFCLFVSVSFFLLSVCLSVCLSLSLSLSISLSLSLSLSLSYVFCLSVSVSHYSFCLSPFCLSLHTLCIHLSEFLSNEVFFSFSSHTYRNWIHLLLMVLFCIGPSRSSL